ncbi:type II toxin-antitoxin system RelE/ParE family toxin [Candidatus Woesearchaeota archaeon]|nr:type II toxin-antitoxin system RelE/ParE family toxin [Candidatus Woesearchaeota archaeon]
MMYTINYSEHAVKQIEKLELETQRRIITTLERIRIRPYPHVKKLVENPYFRLRAGDYRIILDIKESELIILFIEVGHRKKVYK